MTAAPFLFLLFCLLLDETVVVYRARERGDDDGLEESLFPFFVFRAS